MQLRLSARFTLLLTAVFLVGTALGGIVLWQLLQSRAQDEIAAQGQLLIETMNSVRRYTSSHVRPLLADDLETEEQFISESVPAFSARAVFEGFRESETYASFLYKEASLNPTNPANSADSFEVDILAQLADGELTGFRTLDGQEVFYIARPMRLGSEGCLACHSDPASAPQSLLNTYGDQGGFGFELDDLIAAQMIYVPAEQVFNAAWQTFSWVMSLYVVVFAFSIYVINRLLRQYVLHPITAMSGLAEKISDDQMAIADLQAPDLSKVTDREDELGRLARVFHRMAAEVYTRTERLREQLQQLVIEVDDIQRHEQVTELIESDFFQTLRTRSRELRERRDSS
jgi:methyl-accepting chemotaxis protein